MGFCGAAPNPIPLDPSQCVLVNENDGRLKYGPGWTLATSDPFGEHRTSHSTTVNGSSVVVDFNGTSIVVFGTVPQSNATFAPPSASYSIDGHRPIELSLPTASICIPNQQFFRSPELPPGAHNLTINVITPNATSYTLDYLYFCTNQPARSSNSTSAETKAVAKDKFSRLDGIILGSVLGGVVFLLGIAALVWYFVRQRKRLRKLRQLHIAASPVSSWLHWNSRSEPFVSPFSSHLRLIRLVLRRWQQCGWNRSRLHIDGIHSTR
ncbi:hypothetical protein FKP32DRAFT_1574800 [Trametes sanguinea]|nr:hypothetical protein FKP32DRAFT_1574800 [Trametes sanguinea]